MAHFDEPSVMQWHALLDSIRRLCRVYWGPSEEGCRRMLEPSFLTPFITIQPLMEMPVRSHLDALQALIRRFATAGALFDYLEAGYVRLFVNSRNGITAPLYASCYEDEGNPQLMGHAAEDMQALLADLGMAISSEIGEPADHIAIQLEVLFFLLDRRQTPCSPEGLRDAAQFAAEWMNPWVRRLYAHLENEDECRFYPLFTAIMLSVLNAIARLHPDGRSGR